MPYLLCPDCGKKGVTLRLRRNGEDHYGCRYCPWYAFTLDDFESDRINLARLAELNPGVTT